MKTIPLTQGKVALVDDVDYEWLSQWKWCAARGASGIWYAMRWHSIRMHRVILELEKGIGCDHRDGDGLNNQRHNLRVAGQLTNGRNRKRSSNNTSGFKGVTFDPQGAKTGHWRARITYRYALINLGFFPTAEQAAHAYDQAAIRYHKEFAKLNFGDFSFDEHGFTAPKYSKV